MNDEGKLPAEPWILPVALYAGLLQTPPKCSQRGKPIRSRRGCCRGWRGSSASCRSFTANRLWRDFVAAAGRDANATTGRRSGPQPSTSSWASNRTAGTQAAVGHHRYRAPLGSRVSSRQAHPALVRHRRLRRALQRFVQQKLSAQGDRPNEQAKRLNIDVSGKRYFVRVDFSTP